LIPVLNNRMNKKLTYYGFFAFILLLFGCSIGTLDNDPGYIGWNYFPLDSGSYRVYHVTDITYTLGGVTDTSKYFLKETITGPYDNLERNVSFRISREVKAIDGENWEQDSIWWAKKDLKTAVVVENNIPIIKLVFPLKENKSWDANTENVLEEDMYMLKNVGMAITDTSGIGASYEKTVIIEQESINDNIIYKDQRTEIYAENIGMVYKERIFLNYCDEDDCRGQNIIDTGTDFRMVLLENGKD